METRILAVDREYTPDRWLSGQSALNLHSRGVIQDSLGDVTFRLNGGTSASTGEQSFIEISSIVVIATKSYVVSDFGYAPLSRRLLFRRDQHICSYCGEQFPFDKLEAEHIIPESRGGEYTWTNLTTSCGPCNRFKRDRLPEEAGMELLFVPYRPSRFEYLILANHRILADQMSALIALVPDGSRLHS